MFHFCTTRNNALAYLLWSWIFRKNGKITAQLDTFYFGASRGINDYNELVASYDKSSAKPDKLYSILPTVLNLAGDCTGMTAVDIGCGGGFFTVPLAQLGAAKVYGLDNSEGQIELAKKISAHASVHYFLADVFVDELPQADLMVIPFVLNYARTVHVLSHFLNRIYRRLSAGGRAVFVIDLPNRKQLQKFGAIKTFRGTPSDETQICIDLFNGDKKICTLTSVYFTPETIVRLLQSVGFRNICWHEPIVSDEGIRAMGPEFWEGYTADPELGYLTAEK
ncbi:MAG: class I SAM-dependent methyltransferase [Patescibacteria group bacterium]